MSDHLRFGQRSIIYDVSTSFPLGGDFFVNHLLGNWTIPLIGLMKLNLEGSHRRGSSIMGCGGLMRGYNGTWIFGFSSFEGTGEAHLAELR